MPTKIIHIKSSVDIEEASDLVFASLQVKNRQMRTSENYPKGVYFTGKVGGIKIKVAGESDAGWEDYQYWVVISLPDKSDRDVEKIVKTMIAELLGDGFEAARETGYRQNNITREIYWLDDSGNVQSKLEDRALDN